MKNESNNDNKKNNNNSNLEKGEKNERNEILENQIETMLDDIIRDKEEDNLKFSDDENSSFVSDNKETNLNIIDYNDNNDMNSFLFLSNMSQSEEFDFNQNFFPRNNKKFSTVSCQGKDNLNNCLNNNNNYILPSPINSQNYSFFYPNNNIFNNLDFNSIIRNEQRKKTVDSDISNNYLFNNNINLNLNKDSNNINNRSNSISSLSTFNSNKNLNSTNQNSYFLQNNLLSNSNFNNSKIQSNIKNNDILNINNNFLYHNDLHKRFLTTLIPQGTNMQIEILLYELNCILSKKEKIDFFTYTNKIKGNIINIIKTHKGSKLFQNNVKSFSSDIIHQIFLEISSSLIELIIDPYANYFIKKFYNYLNEKDKIDFLLFISDYFVKLSTNIIGTYPIQGIIELITSKNEKKIIVNAIKDSLIELCYDKFGTHILEKIISCFENEYIEFIFDFVEKNFLLLSNHINGICIVKKIVSYLNKKYIHEKIKKIINDNAINLIQHPYGNYVIQTLIDYWEIDEILQITLNFKNKFTFLSNLKYSSNVVEKLMEKSEIILKEYINEICKDGKISEIMKNNFGNYVIQKALKISVNEDKKKLIEEVNKNIFKINDKKLILKWKSILENYNDYSFNNGII
jgi:hypothetical protein